MTINEAIEILAYKDPYNCPVCHSDEAVQVTIETMRKYQKIQEIVKNTQHLCEYGSAFIDIRKVVEDGDNST